MTGSLSTLNVGEGDIEMTFDGTNDTELEKALDMLEDMVKRGYAILVKQVDGSFQRAVSIDRASKSYLIAEPRHFSEAQTVKVTDGVVETPLETKPQKGRRGPKRQSVATSEAVSVGRSAGG